MSKTHKCAATGCTKTVPNTMLMCRAHWFSVPKPIRDRVWTWYGAKGRGVEGADAKAREATREAIRAVQRAQPQKSLFP